MHAYDKRGRSSCPAQGTVSSTLSQGQSDRVHGKSMPIKEGLITASTLHLGNNQGQIQTSNLMLCCRI
jgi:hypothetical protein